MVALYIYKILNIWQKEKKMGRKNEEIAYNVYPSLKGHVALDIWVQNQ